jgi:hypothetical protein
MSIVVKNLFGLMRRSLFGSVHCTTVDQHSGFGPSFDSHLYYRIWWNIWSLNIIESLQNAFLPQHCKNVYAWQNICAHFILFQGHTMKHFLWISSACKADSLTAADILSFIPHHIICLVEIVVLLIFTAEKSVNLQL